MWQNGGRDANRTRTFRLAYYSAVAYQDYNIGKILAKLKTFGKTAEKTATVLFGDHGPKSHSLQLIASPKICLQWAT